METKAAEGGFSLLELIVTATALSVAVLALSPVITLTRRKTTPLEAGTLLSAAAQKTSVELKARLAGNKRLFGRGDADASFLARLVPGLSAAPLAGSRLPAVPSSGTAVPGDVGNSLLFAAAGPAAELADVMNGAGAGSTARVNTCVFYYYYLAADAARGIGGVPARDLWEWTSAPYADFQGLAALSDATQQHEAIARLVAPPHNLLYAFNTAAADASSAFYRLSASPPWISPDPGHTLVSAGAATMTAPSRDGLTCSISPNTGGSFTHRFAVPAYGKAEGDFPSGFETLVSGPPENRRVQARIVMAAEGRFQGFLSCEQTVSVLVQDAATAAPAR